MNLGARHADHRQSVSRSVQRKEPEERFDTLVEQAGVMIERIVSTGQASPPGFWYDSPRAEWVVLLSGAASLEFEEIDGNAQPS